MCCIWEPRDEVPERHLADHEPAVRVLAAHLGVLEVRRVLAAVVRRAEPVLHPVDLVWVQLRLEQRDDAQWDEEDEAHDIAVHLGACLISDCENQGVASCPHLGVGLIAHEEPRVE